MVEIARLGFGKGAGMLALFVALLWSVRQCQTVTITDDDFPPEMMIGDVPSWAFDMYSREGRRALAVLLEGNCETARWVHAHIPSRQQIKFLGGVLFRVEGGLVRPRLRWPTGDELRWLMDKECHGPHCSNGTEILQLMRCDIAALNEVRSHVC